MRIIACKSPRKQPLLGCEAVHGVNECVCGWRAPHSRATARTGRASCGAGQRTRPNTFASAPLLLCPLQLFAGCEHPRDALRHPAAANAQLRVHRAAHAAANAPTTRAAAAATDGHPFSGARPPSPLPPSAHHPGARTEQRELLLQVSQLLVGVHRAHGCRRHASAAARPHPRAPRARAAGAPPPRRATHSAKPPRAAPQPLTRSRTRAPRRGSTLAQATRAPKTGGGVLEAAPQSTPEPAHTLYAPKQAWRLPRPRVIPARATGGPGSVCQRRSTAGIRAPGGRAPPPPTHTRAPHASPQRYKQPADRLDLRIAFRISHPLALIRTPCRTPCDPLGGWTPLARHLWRRRESRIPGAAQDDAAAAGALRDCSSRRE